MLSNRGIEDINEFLNVSEKHCLDYGLLDNIDEAVKCMVKHIENGSNVFIIVDSDVDGVCSAAMIYQYLKRYNSALNVSYGLHTGKQHGFSYDINIPEGTDLIICPDSASNDYEEHKKYNEMGIDIIVLDHHEADCYSEWAIVVNNQLSNNYTNKSFSGAGITYKFLTALDDELWNNDADNYLDLVAVANIGDVMDSRSLETRYYMTAGLQKLKSNAIKALFNKVQDRAGPQLTLISVAFYIVPLVNAMIRVGTQEQKELMFQAFCHVYSEYDYTKRDKSVIKETVYDRMARECANAKARQDRQKANVAQSVAGRIESKGLDANQIIMCNVDDLITSELTGLVCTNIAERYKRPTLLYRTKIEEVDGEDVVLYSGSARNYDGFELEDLRGFLNDTKLFELASGHAKAFGIGFKPENETAIIKVCNEKLKEYSVDYTYFVDFIIPFEELGDNVFFEMGKLKYIYGQKVDEPLFAILDIDVLLNKVEIIRGKTGTTLKFEVDGINFIRFKVRDDDELLRICEDWDYDKPEARINIVGRIGINSYGGMKSKQVVISDLQINH